MMTRGVSSHVLCKRRYAGKKQQGSTGCLLHKRKMGSFSEEEHKKHFTLYMQAYHRDTAGLVPNHCDQVNVAVKGVTRRLCFPSAHRSYVPTVVWSVKCVAALRLF